MSSESSFRISNIALLSACIIGGVLIVSLLLPIVAPRAASFLHLHSESKVAEANQSLQQTLAEFRTRGDVRPANRESTAARITTRQASPSSESAAILRRSPQRILPTSHQTESSTLTTRNVTQWTPQNSAVPQFYAPVTVHPVTVNVDNSGIIREISRVHERLDSIERTAGRIESTTGSMAETEVVDTPESVNKIDHPRPRPQSEPAADDVPLLNKAETVPDVSEASGIQPLEAFPDISFETSHRDLDVAPAPIEDLEVDPAPLKTVPATVELLPEVVPELDLFEIPHQRPVPSPKAEFEGTNQFERISVETQTSASNQVPVPSEVECVDEFTPTIVSMPVEHVAEEVRDVEEVPYIDFFEAQKKNAVASKQTASNSTLDSSTRASVTQADVPTEFHSVQTSSVRGEAQPLEFVQTPPPVPPIPVLVNLQSPPSSVPRLDWSIASNHQGAKRTTDPPFMNGRMTKYNPLWDEEVDDLPQPGRIQQASYSTQESTVRESTDVPCPHCQTHQPSPAQPAVTARPSAPCPHCRKSPTSLPTRVIDKLGKMFRR